MKRVNGWQMVFLCLQIKKQESTSGSQFPLQTFWLSILIIIMNFYERNESISIHVLLYI